MLTRRHPLLPWIAVALLGLLLSMFLAGRIAYRRALLHQAEEARVLLNQRAQALQHHIDRFRLMPAVLSLDPQMKAALQHPHDAGQRLLTNERLAQLNIAHRTETLTLIDRNGIAIAASNWREQRSNVGHSYAFRPYFQRAMQGHGEFYAIGVITKVPGYFIAHALYNEQGAAIGVISAKVSLDTAQLQLDWNEGGDLILLSDANGVVFMASQPEWRYALLAPLNAKQERELARTQQYQGQPLRLIEARRDRAIDAGAHLSQIPELSGGARLLWQSLPLPREGWTLHLLRDSAASARVAWLARGVAACVWLLVLAVVGLVWQRLRIARVRTRSQQELETLVQQHVLALRTAQDEIVQAAQASVGQSQRLEHLPQGISVIDSQLRLVAWNRRYAELFRYPVGLLQVGRPVEDLIRYNAQRGLLGEGDAEEGIRRRLEHLQRAKLYVNEREGGDGSVVEIRVHPLPEGGFVTSYTDITTYRHAARALRTLADSLERRVQEQTSILREAKEEAEQAARATTRLIAGIVHELGQPLHVARMRLLSLRQHGGEDVRLLIDDVDAALCTQEDMLDSALEISRLESGAVEARLVTFPLNRLLAGIDDQFQLSAQSRGVRLRAHQTRVLVTTDEAWLRRILQILMANALQFTPPGGRIVLGVRRRAHGVRIEVHDTGCGIPTDKHESIFEPFQRVDSAPGHEARGVGLGLAVVQRIAALLKVPVGGRSRVSAGSVFFVDVPRAHGVPGEPIDDYRD